MSSTYRFLRGWSLHLFLLSRLPGVVVRLDRNARPGTVRCNRDRLRTSNGPAGCGVDRCGSQAD